jgi:hypothetical protein
LYLQTAVSENSYYILWYSKWINGFTY